MQFQDRRWCVRMICCLLTLTCPAANCILVACPGSRKLLYKGSRHLEETAAPFRITPPSCAVSAWPADTFCPAALLILSVTSSSVTAASCIYVLLLSGRCSTGLLLMVLMQRLALLLHHSLVNNQLNPYRTAVSLSPGSQVGSWDIHNYPAPSAASLVHLVLSEYAVDTAESCPSPTVLLIVWGR